MKRLRRLGHLVRRPICWIFGHSPIVTVLMDTQLERITWSPEVTTLEGRASSVRYLCDRCWKQRWKERL